MDTIDKKAFFDGVRNDLFKGRLLPPAVTGMSSLIDAAEARNWRREFIAYLLATTYHETARRMAPIEEFGKGKGRVYGRPDPVHVYYGRGYVQLTWKSNYEKVGSMLGIDLVGNPSMALDPVVAAHCAVLGMELGLFTGRKLSNFVTPRGFDAVGARRIINGRNKKRFEQGLDRDADYDAVIAGYYEKFLKNLKASDETSEQAPTAVPSPDVDTVVKEEIGPVETPAVKQDGVLLTILKIIFKAIFK